MSTPANRPRRWRRTIATAGAFLLVTGCVATVLVNAVLKSREAAERAD